MKNKLRLWLTINKIKTIETTKKSTVGGLKDKKVDREK